MKMTDKKKNIILKTRQSGFTTIPEIGRELEKCENDPYYFYTEYCRIDGERPEISEERFNEVWKQYLDSPSSTHLIKSRTK